jgi:hypothetical protein
VKRFFILSFACVAACVTNPEPPESTEEACDRICQRTGECPGLTGGESCVESCIASHYPAPCADAIVDSKCSELTAGVQGGAVWVGACYPKCSPDGVACQKDVLVACTLGRYEQQDCSFRCKAKGETYSGVCAKTRNGVSTPTGLPDCWCD